MAWVSQPRRSGELYARLERRESEALQCLNSTTDWTAENPVYTATRERVADFRCRRSVSIPAANMPAWWRNGRSFDWQERAVVSADGSVRLIDDARTWLAENDLI